MFHLFVKFLNSSHGSFESAFAKDNVLVYPRLKFPIPLRRSKQQSFGLGNGQIDGNFRR
jgi:hypothetical protein